MLNCRMPSLLRGVQYVSELIHRAFNTTHMYLSENNSTDPRFALVLRSLGEVGGIHAAGLTTPPLGRTVN